jgi:hypothetical protein
MSALEADFPDGTVDLGSMKYIVRAARNRDLKIWTARLCLAVRGSTMQSAQAFREQAFKCLQLARQVRNSEAAENLRCLARRYCERALEIEESHSHAGANAGHFVKPLLPTTKP